MLGLGFLFVVCLVVWYALQIGATSLSARLAWLAVPFAFALLALYGISVAVEGARATGDFQWWKIHLAAGCLLGSWVFLSLFLVWEKVGRDRF